MKYATFDETTGVLSARYDSEFHSPDQIPAGAKPLTDDEFWKTCNEQDGVWTWTLNGLEKLAFPAPTLASVKAAQANSVRQAFASVVDGTVDVGGVLYQGGFDSAIKLDAARRLCEAAGLTTTTFYDALNQAHVLSLADALLVVIAVSAKYQTDFGIKQGLMNQIDAATTEAQVLAVTWPV